MIPQKVVEYGRLVVARSNEPGSKIRVQLLVDLLYRRRKLNVCLPLYGIHILFVPAILEDPRLDVSWRSIDKNSIFLMVPFVIE